MSAEFLEELENTAIEISADPDDPADVREVGILVLIVRARLQVGKEWAENPNEWMTPFLKDYDSIGEQIDEIFNEETD